jgi:hypothetical protein
MRKKSTSRFLLTGALLLERENGFSPPSLARFANVLKLNYSRITYIKQT